MKPYRTAAITFAALSAFLAACETTGWTQRRGSVEDPAITHLRNDVRNLDERINRLTGDVQALQANYERMQQQIASLRQQLTVAATGGGVSAPEIQRLDSRITALDAARKRDQEVIINQVSAELAKMGGGSVSAARRATSSGATPAARVTPSGGRKVIASPGAAGVAGAGQQEQGYEHVVEKGQNLSAIAKAYGVTVEKIKQANNLKSDILHIGQKLFIPKP
jgi:LysM repeat protein